VGKEEWLLMKDGGILKLIDASGKESVKKKRRRVNGKAHPQ
jgi:hypothetical protein